MIALGLAATVMLGVPVAQAPAGWQDTHRLAMELLLDDKTMEAIALLEKVVADAPGLDEARYTLATAHESHARRAALDDPPRPDERRRHLEQAALHLRQLAAGQSDLRPVAVARLMSLYDKHDLDDPREAVAFARQFVALEPQSAMGHVTLVRALRATGDDKAATQALLAARTAVGPTYELPLAVAITDYLVGGAPDGETTPQPPPVPREDLRTLIEYATPVFDRALAEDPDDRMVKMAKASLLVLRAQRLETDPARRARLEEEADDLVFRPAAGRETQGEPPDVAFVAMPPPDSVTLRTAAEALLARKAYAEAVALYDTFLETHPTSVEAHYGRVEALLAGGQGALLTSALDGARRALPHDAEVRHLMGRLLLDIAKQPDLPEAHVRTLLGEATAVLDEALAVASKTTTFTALVTKRLVLTEQARHETDPATVARLTTECVLIATRAEALTGPRPFWPEGAAAIEAESAVLEARGEHARAAAVYDGILTQHPDFLMGHVQRLRLLASAGATPDVKAPLQAARAAARVDTASRRTAGQAYWDVVYRSPGLAPATAGVILDEAVTLLDEALSAEPEDATTMLYKSLVLRQQAGLDTNTARAGRLTAEADRLRTRAEALMSNRQP